MNIDINETIEILNKEHTRDESLYDILYCKSQMAINALKQLLAENKHCKELVNDANLVIKGYEDELQEQKAEIERLRKS